MRVSLYRGTYFFFGCNLTLSTSGSGFARFFFFGTPLPHGWLEFVSFHRDRATVWPPLKKKLETFFSFSLSSAAFNFINFCLKNRKKNQFFSVCVCVFLPLQVHQERSTCPELKFDSGAQLCHPISFSHGTKKKIKRGVGFFLQGRD
jgi:hypothetical protein